MSALILLIRYNVVRILRRGRNGVFVSRVPPLACCERVERVERDREETQRVAVAESPQKTCCSHNYKIGYDMGKYSSLRK